MNTFGNIFRITSAGESHGPALAGIIDGMPAGIAVDLDEIQAALDRRKPSQPCGSGRGEEDKITVLSGLFGGKTTGTPIAFTIPNTDAHSADYDNLKDVYRPNHADYTYAVKYGIRDHRGGGRASARETAIRVAAGAFADAALRQLYGVSVAAYTAQIGPIALPEDYSPDLQTVYDFVTRCPHAPTDAKMREYLANIAAAGDTIGGIVEGRIFGLPAGVGEPIYGKLQAMLAAAMLSINAAKGFDYGSGFKGVPFPGSALLDPVPVNNSDWSENHSGGILGGISTGLPVTFRVAFKPIATMMRPLPAVKVDGTPFTLIVKGRHDICAVPRAVPVVAAMASITALDALLLK